MSVYIHVHDVVGTLYVGNLEHCQHLGTKYWLVYARISIGKHQSKCTLGETVLHAHTLYIIGYIIMYLCNTGSEGVRSYIQVCAA